MGRWEGGAPCVRRVLLRERQEQLCDAELQRMSLLVMLCGVHVESLSAILVFASVQMCVCTDVQPSSPEATGVSALCRARVELHVHPRTTGARVLLGLFLDSLLVKQCGRISPIEMDAP